MRVRIWKRLDGKWRKRLSESESGSEIGTEVRVWVSVLGNVLVNSREKRKKMKEGKEVEKRTVSFLLFHFHS